MGGGSRARQAGLLVLTWSASNVCAVKRQTQAVVTVSRTSPCVEVCVCVCEIHVV